MVSLFCKTYMFLLLILKSYCYDECLTQVPLFQHMDNLVLENICDRVKSLIFTKGETVSPSELKSLQLLPSFNHKINYHMIFNI